MSYSFHIGKIQIEYERDEYPVVVLGIEPCDDDPKVHHDEWELVPNLGSSSRYPGYLVWNNICKGAPKFDDFMSWLEDRVKENRQYYGSVIPCGVYIDKLDQLEKDCEGYSKEAKARILWFIRWSRKAFDLYDDAAGFKTPGEW